MDMRPAMTARTLNTRRSPRVRRQQAPGMNFRMFSASNGVLPRRVEVVFDDGSDN